jgi:hypothetical protein
MQLYCVAHSQGEVMLDKDLAKVVREEVCKYLWHIVLG